MTKEKMIIRKGIVGWWRSLLLLLLTIEAAIGGPNPKTKRSAKDAFPKTEVPSKFAGIRELRDKVTILEDVYMKARQQRLQNANEFTAQITKQSNTIKQLETQLLELRVGLSANADLVSERVDPDEIGHKPDDTISHSNHTCGGAIVGHKGFIIYDYSKEDRGQIRPTSCMWAIRAKDYPSIKIAVNSIHRSKSHRLYARGAAGLPRKGNEAYVVQLVPANNNATRADSLRVTRLREHAHHVLPGPVAFIVYSFGQYEDAYDNVAFRLHYEGTGKKARSKTQYSHVELDIYDPSQTFAESDIPNWLRKQIFPNITSNSSYLDDFATIVVSNFSTKAWLRVDFNRNQCEGTDQFLLFPNALDNGRSGSDCCKTDCSQEVILSENPALMVISKKFNNSFNFQAKWENDRPYPPDSSFVSHTNSSEYVGTPCGQVLGGYFGKIRYKPGTTYNDYERCIWVIAPRPIPKAEIRLTLTATGVEPYHDHLYFMEITDVNGTLLKDGPKITNLTTLTLSYFSSYVAHAREVYVVFYSDDSISGTGFSISYEVVGEPVTSLFNASSDFLLLKESNNGALSSQLSQRHPQYKVVGITPFSPDIPYGRVLNLNLGRGTPFSNANSHECQPNPVYQVFITVKGIFTKAPRVSYCNNNASDVIIRVPENMALIVINNALGEVKTPLEFSYEQDLPEQTRLIRTDDISCGGVIEGDIGVIRYKPTTMYFASERCIWIIHSRNKSRIDFSLQKHGFERCCDYIVVTTVDPESGSLIMNGNGTRISEQNKTTTVDSPLAIVLFQSDGSSQGKGFVLLFEATGDPPPLQTPYSYIPVHEKAKSGQFTSPNPDLAAAHPGSNSTTENIVVFAYSPQMAEGDGISTRDVKTSLKLATFERLGSNSNNQCEYESLWVYTYGGMSTWNRTASLPRYQVSRGSSEDSCQTSITTLANSNWFEEPRAAFLAIHRHKKETNGQIAFEWTKASDCGGVIVGASGVISYKEQSTYRSYERCIWLIEVPEAASIRFHLANQFFEPCCDYLLLSSINPVSGTPGPVTQLGASTRTTSMNGPVVIVALSTDSSVNNKGFRLTFSKQTTRTSASVTPSIRLLHEDSSPTTYPVAVESNEVIVVAHSAPVNYMYYSGSTRSRVLEVNVTVFRPQVSSTCVSDKLTIYKFPASEGVHTESRLEASQVYRNLPRVSCTPIVEDATSYCTSIEKCAGLPRNITTIVNSFSGTFIAIYKSADVIPNGNMSARGFVLKTRTVPRPLI